MDLNRAMPVTIGGTEVDVGDTSSIWQNFFMCLFGEARPWFCSVLRHAESDPTEQEDVTCLV